MLGSRRLGVLLAKKLAVSGEKRLKRRSSSRRGSGSGKGAGGERGGQGGGGVGGAGGEKGRGRGAGGRGKGGGGSNRFSLQAGIRPQQPLRAGSASSHEKQNACPPLPPAGSLVRVFWGVKGGKKGGFTSDSSNTPRGRRTRPYTKIDPETLIPCFRSLRSLAPRLAVPQSPQPKTKGPIRPKFLNLESRNPNYLQSQAKPENR